MPPSLPVVGQGQHSGFVAFENMIPPFPSGWAGGNVEDLDSPWPCQHGDNLATWQRDAHFLQEQGLSLTQVEGLDMFPQTPHLEVLSVFEQK